MRMREARNGDGANGAIKGGVHNAVAHDSARKHVTGAAIYVDDIPEPTGGFSVLTD